MSTVTCTPCGKQFPEKSNMYLRVKGTIMIGQDITLIDNTDDNDDTIVCHQCFDSICRDIVIKKRS